jgi:hypothetical protein
VTQILVPRDLLSGIDGASARHKRILVTGWILGYRDRDPLPGLRRARDVWPADRLNSSRGGLTALTILLELEALGICSNVSVRDEEFFTVEVSAKETTAA